MNYFSFRFSGVAVQQSGSGCLRQPLPERCPNMPRVSYRMNGPGAAFSAGHVNIA
ncbi:hypothetical protein [Burkholderia dolosa]|uniref:hypothetical protein n=1 Tax=Burkholderia dolosa TaxID=152500 RepID=UPI0027D26D9B|nr:hypothetical protein [Burkholderia dolosa]